MKTAKILLVVILLTISGLSFGQVRIVNSTTNISAPNSSAFIDASSNSGNNSTTNIGKGLLYPRVNLTTFVAFSGSPIGIPTSYPTRYDGLVVYNTATGAAGIGGTNVNPGFYYYSNQSASVTGGKWVRMNDNNISSTPKGISFPTVPAPSNGDVFYRTDVQDFYYYNGTLWIGVSNKWIPAHPYVQGNMVQYNGNYYIANTSFTSDPATFSNDIANWNDAGGKDGKYSVTELRMDNEIFSKVSISGSTVVPGDEDKTLVTVGYLNGPGGSATNFSGSLSGDVTGTQGATVIGAGKVTNSMLAGSIASSKLVGTDITTIGTLTTGSVPYSLLSGTVPTWNQNTTGNAATATAATTAGTATDFSGSLAGDVSGTQGATVIGAGKVTNSMLAGSIASSKLVGTDITIIGTLTTGSVPYSLLSGTVPTWNQNTTGNAATAIIATNTTNTNITNDVSASTAVYPTWVSANTGNLPQNVSSTKLSFVPSTGVLTSTAFVGSGAGLTNLPGSVLNVTSEQSGSYTALASDDIILFNVATAEFTLTLPTTGIPVGKKYYISNKGGQSISISPLPREETTPFIPPVQACFLMYIGGTGNGSWSFMSGY